MTVAEVAAIFDVSKGAVYYWICTGRLKATGGSRVRGQGYRIRRTDAEAFKRPRLTARRKPLTPPGYLSARQVAEIIGVTGDAILKAIRDGRVKSTKRCGVRLIRVKDAEQFKAEHDAWKAAAKERRLALEASKRQRMSEAAQT